MGSFNRDSRGGARSFDRPRFGGNSFNRGGDRGSDRPLFKTVCSNCGKDCEVPFRPTNGKPVYCSDCFEKMGNTRSDSGRQGFGRDERPNFRPQAPAFDQSRAQLDAINVKLDRILRMLEPKVTPVVAPVEVEKNIDATEVKEVKVSKSKKTTSAKKK